jgi:hypothetical protein
MMNDKRLLPIGLAAIALSIPLTIAAARAFDHRPLSWAQTHRLDHLAWPQSQGAMMASMGEPARQEGAYDLYPMYDGRTAYVKYSGGRAVSLDAR